MVVLRKDDNDERTLAHDGIKATASELANLRVSCISVSSCYLWQARIEGRLSFTMQAPPRSPLRPPLASSPSVSLLGMEQVIPPGTPSTGRITRTSSAFADKPLPDAPRRSSSMYSDGVSEIIEAYLAESPSGDNYLPPPVVLQPVAYRETIVGLLNSRLEEPPSPTSLVSRTSIFPRATPSPASLAESIQSGTSAQPLAGRRTRQVKAISPPLPSPSLGFRAIHYDSAPENLVGSTSPRITQVIDSTLVPLPLALSRDVVGGDRPASRFSRTSSSGSSLIYNPGIRSSIRSFVRNKLHHGKRDPAEKEKKRIMSFASAKYPHMNPSRSASGRSRRRGSWTSGRRPSFQQGLSSAYGMLRKMSITSSSNSSGQKEQQDPRRHKQLAIPTSPYQKYGPRIWEPPKKQRNKKKRNAEAPLRTKRAVEEERRMKHSSASPTAGRHSDYAKSFENGTNQLVGALQGGRRRFKMAAGEKKREELKKSIKMVGPASQPPDAHTSDWV